MYMNASISSDCTGSKKKREGKNSSIADFLLLSLQSICKLHSNAVKKSTCNYSQISVPSKKNSQPLNLHFAVAEIFTLKSITLCVRHILEHRKSIYLGVMRNSGMNLAKELLQSPPLFILSALYTCTTSPTDPRHIQKKKKPKKPCNILVEKIPLILHVI